MRYHYAQGKVGAGHQRFLGYERTEDASLRIVPEEADIIRRIFREYLEGDSPGLIAKRLTDERVTWRCNKTGKWTGQTLKYMMQNEKYAGNLLLQKYHTVDFLTKKVEKNNGAVPQYYVENSHPPIVPYEVFLQAQGEMMRRGEAYGNAFKAGEHGYKKLSNKMFFSGRLICPQCGQSYWRKLEHGRHVWRCINQDCKSPAMLEAVLHQAVKEAFNRLPEERGNLLLLRDQIERGLLTPIDAQLEAMDEDAPERAQLIMQRAEYAQKVLQISTLLTWLDGPTEQREYGPICSDYNDFLERTHRLASFFPMTSFRDDEAIRFLEKINVHSDKLEVVFKAGVTIEVALA